MADPEEKKGISIQDILGILGPEKSVSPWLTGGMAGMGILGNILSEVFGDNPQKEMLEFSLDQRKRLLPILYNLPESTNEGDVTKRLSLSKQFLQPEMDKLAFNAASGSGMDSGEASRMAMGQIGNILSKQELDIRNWLTSIGERRREFKYGTIAGMI